MSSISKKRKGCLNCHYRGLQDKKGNVFWLVTYLERFSIVEMNDNFNSIKHFSFFIITDAINAIQPFYLGQH